MWSTCRSFLPKIRPIIASFGMTTNRLSPISNLRESTERFYHVLTAAPSHSLLQSIAGTKFTQIPADQSKSLLRSNGGPLMLQSCGFKVKGRLRRRCKDCYFVVRQERKYVICKTHPRHKQMALKRKEHNSYIMTHWTLHKTREW